MSWGFRKSVSLGKGSRLNLSKSGIGLSAGIKGFRVGVSSRRGSYVSTSIPGTGLYSTHYGSKKARGSTSGSGKYSRVSGGSEKGCLILILAILVLVLIIFVPIVGISLLVISLVSYYAWTQQSKQKIKRNLTKARLLFSQKNYEEAKNILIETYELDNTNNDVVCMLGETFCNLERFEEAIKYLENFSSKDPDNFDSQLILATCLYRLNKHKEAVSILQKIPENLNQNIKVIQLLGSCFLAEENYDLAINVFKKGPLRKRNLDKDLLEIHYNLGLSYEGLGDKNNALKHFRKVYAQDIDYRDASQKVEILEIQN